MTQALRKQVFGSIMKQEPAWFGNTSTGELVNRLSADTQLVGRNLSSNVSDGLRSLFMVGAGTGMMVSKTINKKKNPDFICFKVIFLHSHIFITL